MKIYMALILIGFVAAGCSSVAHADKVVPNMPSGNPGIAGIATEGTVTEEMTVGSSSTPPAMRVQSTPIPLIPIQGNTEVSAYTPTPISVEGWKIFTNASLGIAVNYPPDWSVTEQSSNEATFTSPQGTKITLTAGGASSYGNEIRIGNQRCLSRANANNLTADVCVDTASFSYSAKFTLKSANGTAETLTLTMTTRNTADVFEGMFNSVRPVK